MTVNLYYSQIFGQQINLLKYCGIKIVLLYCSSGIGIKLW